MDKETWIEIAKQLRRPNGEYAVQVAENMNQGNRLINEITIEAQGLKSGDNQLEIGMGNGFFVKDILSVTNAIKYTGCDYSDSMVQQASILNKEFIDKGFVKFFLSNAENLPFKNETFNKVFTINTIYFWEDQKLILSEIHRVLKPEGKLLIAFRPKSVMLLYPFASDGFNLFTKNDLRLLLAKNNFKVIDILEKDEPQQTINNEIINVKTIVVIAEK